MPNRNQRRSRSKENLTLRVLIGTPLEKDYQTILHAKYLSSRPYYGSDEDVQGVCSISLCKSDKPSANLTPRIMISRNLVEDHQTLLNVKYLIPKHYSFAGKDFQRFQYAPPYKSHRSDGFDLRCHALNKLGRCTQHMQNIYQPQNKVHKKISKVFTICFYVKVKSQEVSQFDAMDQDLKKLCRGLLHNPSCKLSKLQAF